jgi:hypothetical protein
VKYDLAKKKLKCISKSTHDTTTRELFYDVESRKFLYYNNETLIETTKNIFDRDDVSLYHFIQSGKAKK